MNTPLLPLLLLCCFLASGSAEQWPNNYTSFFNATVDSLTDYPEVDAAQCAPGALPGDCTLRNAAAYCSLHLANATDHCTIFLPHKADIVMKNSEIAITDRMGNMTIMGRGSTISKFPSLTDFGLFRVDAGGSRRIIADQPDSFHFNLHNMTIQGFGNTDDAGGAVWLGSVALSFFEHLTFIGCKGRDGGAIDLQSTSFVTIFHCEFIDNYCVGNGGAVGIGELNDGTVVENCRFVNNKALELGTLGGGFGAGGGVSVDQKNTNITFVNNFFSDNSAPVGGGVTIAEDNYGVVFQNNYFLRNRAFLDGGGLCCYDSNRLVSFEGDVFDDNVCFYRGGGIYFYRNMNRLTFTNVTFLNNHAADGGGFYGYYDNTAIDFYNCDFINNSARDGGGAFFLYQNNVRMALYDCRFENNFATLQGGAIESRANEYFSIQRSKFINNECEILDGGAVNFGIDCTFVTVFDSFFIGNHAGTDGGGLFFGANNNFLTLRNDTFIRNTAGNYGAGISIRSNNINGKLSGLSFTSNTAGVAGGAMHSALRNSHLLMADFVMTLNTAASYAGGIYFGNDHSNISLVGGIVKESVSRNGAGVYVSQFNTNFEIAQITFLQNHALVDGGGLIVQANIVTMQDCVFEENLADNDCGGMCIKEASFDDNHAVNIINCFFTENVGNNNHGGLQIVDRQGVAITNSVFHGNHAVSGVGGGMSITSSSEVIIDNTVIDHNDCLLGGAGLNIMAVINFTVSSSAIDNNRAIRGSGGGMRTQMTSGLKLLNVSMTQNYADLEGGGMHISGVEIQLLDLKSDVLLENSFISKNVASKGCGSAIWITQCFLEVRGNVFSWNRAPMGGGTLFWSYSSGMDEPTSSNNVWDSSNYGLYGSKWATEGNQLIISRESNEYSIHSPINVTAYNAAVPYFLVSIVDFYKQLIMNNNQTMVDVSVPSNSECTDYRQIYNVSAYVAGSIAERVSKGVANFSSLSAYCAPGDDVDVVMSVEALPLDDLSYHGAFEASVKFSFRKCLRGEILVQGYCEKCPVGFYAFDAYHEDGCLACPDNAYCPGGAVIEVDAGYWRQCEDCHEVMSCMNVDACEGGGSVADQCMTGHEGPLCNVCSEDYAFGADDMTCTVCDTDTRNATMTIVVSILVFLFALSMFVYIKRDWLRQKYEFFTSHLEKIAEKYKIDSVMTKLKICFAFFQILGGLPTITNVPYPKSFQSVMDVMAFTNINIFSLFSLGCVTEYSFYDSLRLYTIGPFVFLVAIMLLVVLRVKISKRLNPHNPSYTYKHKNSDRKRMIIIVGFIFFSPASVKIFQTFVCDEFEDGSRTLVADSSIDCDTDKHLAYVVYAVCMLFVYPIGIPLYYFRNLYRVRRLINPPKSTVVTADEAVLISDKVIRKGKMKVREGYENIQKISFLYDSYIPEMWFFEVVECFRRLFLTAVPILFLRSSVMQVILILLISLGCSALYMHVKPFAKDSDNSVATCSQWAISLTVLGSLCLKVDLSDEVSYADELIGILMIIINILVVLLTLKASVTPNESDSRDEAAFEAFNKSLHQDIVLQEEAKRRRSKIGAMGLEKAERVTAWELRQSELMGADGTKSGVRRSRMNLDDFDSDDDSDDEGQQEQVQANRTIEESESDSDNESDGGGDNAPPQRGSRVFEMTKIRNPLR